LGLNPCPLAPAAFRSPISEGFEHAVEVPAASVYEAAVPALGEFVDADSRILKGRQGQRLVRTVATHFRVEYDESHMVSMTMPHPALPLPDDFH